MPTWREKTAPHRPGSLGKAVRRETLPQPGRSGGLAFFCPEAKIVLTGPSDNGGLPWTPAAAKKVRKHEAAPRLPYFPKLWIGCSSHPGDAIFVNYFI
jgi:hypothetical protein